MLEVVRGGISLVCLMCAFKVLGKATGSGREDIHDGVKNSPGKRSVLP